VWAALSVCPFGASTLRLVVHVAVQPVSVHATTVSFPVTSRHVSDPVLNNRLERPSLAPPVRGRAPLWVFVPSLPWTSGPRSIVLRRSIKAACVFAPPRAPKETEVTDTEDRWAKFAFLLGEWHWVGGGTFGKGTGVSSFRPELNGTVLVRRTHLDYAGSQERDAYSHDDLLFVYHDPLDQSPRAIFFDGEGHVIRYFVTVAPGGRKIQFLSDAAPDGTRARMTYIRTGEGSATERFEIAPPGKPGDFTTHVEFVATRVGP